MAGILVAALAAVGLLLLLRTPSTTQPAAADGSPGAAPPSAPTTGGPGKIAERVAKRRAEAEAEARQAPDAITEEQARAFFEKLEKENPTDHDDSGAYTISRAAKSGRVAVNLSPGSRVSMPMDTEAGPVGPRTIRGRVTRKKGGAPVGGAVVLAAETFQQHLFPSLDGQAATTAMADGTYILPGLSAESFYLLAR